MHAIPADTRPAHHPDPARPTTTRLIAPWAAAGMALLVTGSALAAQPWEREARYGVVSIYSGLVYYSGPFPGPEPQTQHTSLEEHIAVRNWQE